MSNLIVLEIVKYESHKSYMTYLLNLPSMSHANIVYLHMGLYHICVIDLVFIIYENTIMSYLCNRCSAY